MLVNDTLHLPFYIFSALTREFVNSTLFLQSTKIHYLCDGIESNNLMLTEDNVCFQRRVKHINTTDAVSSK